MADPVMNIKILILLTALTVLLSIPAGIAGRSESPDFTDVKLWDYNIDKRMNYNDFWTATNPSKYIIPDNPIIRYYANHTDEIQIDYIPDVQDYWQNPDYTLKIMQGDCEDESLVQVSVHRAKGHKAIVVGGYLYFGDGTVIRDVWYEYVDGKNHQVRFTTPVVAVKQFYAKPLFMFNDRMSIRNYDADWTNKSW